MKKLILLLVLTPFLLFCQGQGGISTRAVKALIKDSLNVIRTSLALKSPLASPTFTGGAILDTATISVAHLGNTDVNGGFITQSTLTPFADASIDIGTSAKKFDSLYVYDVATTKVTADSVNVTTLTAGNTAINGTFITQAPLTPFADATIDIGTNTLAFDSLFIGDIKLSGGIDSVSSTELGYLNGTTSNLQTQLNTKASIAQVSDSLNLKLNKDLSTLTVLTTPDDADVVPVYQDGLTTYRVALSNLPIPSVAQSQFATANTNISNLETRVTALETPQVARRDEVYTILDSLGVLIQALTPNFPAPPTSLNAYAVSTTKDTLIWIGAWRGYSAAIIYSSNNGITYSELARQVGTDSSYANSGLAENTLTYYYVTFFDSTSQKQSYLSNIDTSTTWTSVTPPSETGYFVDDTLSTGLNNGTSWQNAWKSFSDINWNVVTDSLFISGGADSVVIADQLTLGKSGTISNPIIITRGRSTGHNGRVIIKNTATGSKRGFYALNKTYFTLAKIEFQGCDTVVTHAINNFGNITINGSSHFTLDSLIVLSSGVNTAGEQNGAGMFFEDDTTFTVQRCSLYTNTGISYKQTDNIYAQQCTGGTFHNNILRQRNTKYYHNDCFQAYQCANMTYYDNQLYLSDIVSGTDGNGAFTIADLQGGNFKIYNNLVHAGGFSNIDGISVNQYGGTVDSVIIYGNTIYSTAANVYRLINLDGITKPYVKNNICYAPNSRWVNQFTNISDYSQIDYNLVLGSGAEWVAVVNGANKTWTQWKALGADAHGINVNPLFTTDGSDFTLQAGSPCVDAGATLGWIYATDILGVARPQGAGYSMGSYER